MTGSFRVSRTRDVAVNNINLPLGLGVNRAGSRRNVFTRKYAFQHLRGSLLLQFSIARLFPAREASIVLVKILLYSLISQSIELRTSYALSYLLFVYYLKLFTPVIKNPHFLKHQLARCMFFKQNTLQIM